MRHLKPYNLFESISVEREYESISIDKEFIETYEGQKARQIKVIIW